MEYTSELRTTTGIYNESMLHCTHISCACFTNFQESKVEGYTGEGEPPCIVMSLRAVSDETTPPDLTLPVTLTGVREPNNTIVIERTAEGDVFEQSISGKLYHMASYHSALYAAVYIQEFI